MRTRRLSPGRLARWCAVALRPLDDANTGAPGFIHRPPPSWACASLRILRSAFPRTCRRGTSPILQPSALRADSRGAGIPRHISARKEPCVDPLPARPGCLVPGRQARLLRLVARPCAGSRATAAGPGRVNCCCGPLRSAPWNGSGRKILGRSDASIANRSRERSRHAPDDLALSGQMETVRKSYRRQGA